MNSTLSLRWRLRWINLPTLSLITLLLQRSPAVRVFAPVGQVLVNSASWLLKSGFTAAALGGYHSLAGATTLASNPASPVSLTVGTNASIVFAVTGAPATAASYEIAGTLPPGMTIAGLSGDLLNASTVTLAGTPTTAGTYTLRIRAWRGANKTELGGNPSFELVINVQNAATAPSFTQQPQGATVTVGTRVTLTGTATGTAPITFQWRKDGVAVTGATTNTLVIESYQATDAGSYVLVATNAAGSFDSSAAVLTTAAQGQTPVITADPASVTVAPGGSATFTVTATGTGQLTYQWRKDGAAIAGATNTSLTINNLQASNAGDYSVLVSSNSGNTASRPATLQVATPVVGRLIGLSVLTQVTAGSPLIVGFGTRGAGEQSLLVRGVGPTLAAFQVASPLADPRLDVFADGTSGAVASNDNWTTDSGSEKSFPLTAGSKDAVLRTQLVTGTNRTVHLNASTGTNGSALVEAFDAGSTGEAQLLSVSTLKPIAAGEILTAGVAISGNVPKRLLIRGVGPTLAAVGVTGFLANPQLKLFRGQTQLLENDDWELNGNAATIRATPTGLPLANGSKDAAVLVVLPPGDNYTVQVSGVGTASGTVLVEVTEIP